MKEIKFLLSLLCIALLTSLWWTVIKFSCDLCLLAAIILSAILIILAIDYLANHWDNNEKGLKEIKFLLRLLLTAMFTSLWWAAILFPCTPFPLIAVVCGIVVLIAAVTYIVQYWDK